MKKTEKAIIITIAVSMLQMLAVVFDGSVSALETWKCADAKRIWEFPNDHGSHYAYKTEWWYFTGNLSSLGGRRFGYQLTFFRQGIRLGLPAPNNPWSVRDLFFAHFAVTDVQNGRIFSAERASRAGPGLAGANVDNLQVWLLKWSAVMNGATIMLYARDKDLEIALELTPRKPVVLHGNEGFSRKGSDQCQASHYYSFTDLSTKGSIQTPANIGGETVIGTSWFDHEFGSSQLGADQEGWDWFSLHISDGSDLMFYLLRRHDGSFVPESSGTFVLPDGTMRHLRLADLSVTVLDTWKSERSGAVYPSRWKLSLESLGIEFDVLPLVADQELETRQSTNITYWEGLVEGSGTSQGKAVTVEGYVELTGYAGSLAEVF